MPTKKPASENIISKLLKYGAMPLAIIIAALITSGYFNLIEFNFFKKHDNTIIFYTPTISHNLGYAELIEKVNKICEKDINKWEFVVELGNEADNELKYHNSNNYESVIKKYLKNKKNIILMIPPKPEAYINMDPYIENERIIFLDVGPQLSYHRKEKINQIINKAYTVIYPDGKHGAELAAQRIIEYCNAHKKKIGTTALLICDGFFQNRGTYLYENIQKHDKCNTFNTIDSLTSSNLDYDDFSFERSYERISQGLSKYKKYDDIFIFCGSSSISLAARMAATNDPIKNNKHIMSFDFPRIFKTLSDQDDEKYLIGAIDQRYDEMAEIIESRIRSIIEKKNKDKKIIAVKPELIIINN